MEGVDSPLDVLSLAATMIQDRCLPPSYEEARKELPSSRWRKERRSTARESPLLPDYASASARELADAPLDMSTRSRASSRVAEREKDRAEQRSAPRTRAGAGVGAGSNKGTKARGSPPSYSEAISSKSGFRLSTNLPRASVITCAPLSPTLPNGASKSQTKHSGEVLSDDGMCDPVIDEHFRRSLGKDYMTLFAKKSTKSTPNNSSKDGENRNRLAITGLSVDDHFAKALGDTWLKLQAESSDSTVTAKSSGKEPSSSTIPRQRRGVVTI